MTLRSSVTWFETTHAGMESEPASPILCGVLAPSFQVSMPTDGLTLFGLQVKALQFCWHLAGSFWTLGPLSLVAIVPCRCIALVGRRISRPFFNLLNWSQVHIDPGIIHQTSDLLVKWRICIRSSRLQRPCVFRCKQKK